MRVLFLTHYFFPEGNAPATRVYEVCRRWVELGHRVTVVTGAPNVPSGVVYEGYANRWFQREEVAGIETLRVWTWLAANRGTVRRTLNYLSFLVAATLAGLLAPRPDVVIATSPQFFCGWAGALVSRARRLPFVLEVRDLWPESIASVGALRKSPLLRLLERLERALYRAATRIVTVGEGYRDQLVGRGVPSERIEVIPNGVDREMFQDRGGGAALRRRYGLGQAFVCSYVGTIGMASGLDVVLRAARLLREEGRADIRFALVGDGAIREELEERARREGLSEVVFTGRRDKREMPDHLAMTDACLVHLARKDLFRTVLPSKIFEAAAMRKPIVLGVQGRAAELVDGAGAGICIEPENERQLVDAVTRLAADRELAARLGQAGYDEIAARFEWGGLAGRYAELAGKVAEAGRGS
jgi:glycosyltransferase involved in cell wall biosynthesis